MTQVNVHQAKTHLSRLLEAVESGAESEIIIARNGRPIGRLTSIEARPKQKVKLGLAKGKYNFDYDSFQALDADIQELLEKSADPLGQNLSS